MRNCRFADNLIVLRKRTRRKNGKMGYSREALARELCTYSSTVLAWEKGEHEPRLSMLIDLADFFGVTLDQLVFGENIR